jgi:hypothetical protein
MEFQRIAQNLATFGATVWTTAGETLIGCYSTLTNRMDVTAIGRLSQNVKCIIGCVTGPMWPTLNIWAKPALRIHLLDHERVELTPNTVHTNSLSLVPEILQSHGLL